MRSTCNVTQGVQIAITGLVKVYPPGIVALRGIDLEIRLSPFGLLGPNGAGKTTLMRILATLLAPTEGMATVSGYDTRADQAEIRHTLGYLPQQFGLYPNLTAWEFLDYLAMLRGLRDRSERHQCVEKALELTHLRQVAKRRLATFSGGMRQRVGIAQALLQDPPLLILDEPTAGLDPEERAGFHTLLSELSGDRLIMLSTHIVGDVEALCRDVAILQNGEISAHASPQHLVASMAGRVWLLTVPEQAAGEIRQAYTVISMARQEGGMALRLLAEQPPPGAEPAAPTLEDAYFHLRKATDHEACPNLAKEHDA